MGKSFIGDIGTKIETTLNTSLSALTSATYYIKKGDGTSTTWACTVEHTTNGVVFYNTVDGDLNVSGKYITHVSLVYDSGNIFTSDVATFRVYDKYQA